MKKIFILFLIAASVIAIKYAPTKTKSMAIGEICSIHSFQEVGLNDLSSGALVIFDVDETLITPVDILLKPIGGTFKGWEKMPSEQFEHYLSTMLASTRYVLVDPEILHMIAHLASKGISAMGLTACSTGSVGVIESMEEWRCDQLNALGIDFGVFFTEEYEFSELVDAAFSPPLFKKGILFCGGFYHPEKSTKGELLGVFLDRINWTPQQIVFIDDNRKHLEAVQQVLKERRIPFQGYHIQTSSLQLDEKIAELQIDRLLDANKWISDQEAQALFMNQTPR